MACGVDKINGQNHAEIDTLKNVVNPPFLGGFSIFGDVSGVGRTAALPSWLTFFKGTL